MSDSILQLMRKIQMLGKKGDEQNILISWDEVGPFLVFDHHAEKRKFFRKLKQLKIASIGHIRCDLQQNVTSRSS